MYNNNNKINSIWKPQNKTSGSKIIGPKKSRHPLYAYRHPSDTLQAASTNTLDNLQTPAPLTKFQLPRMEKMERSRAGCRAYVAGGCVGCKAHVILESTLSLNRAQLGFRILVGA